MKKHWMSLKNYKNFFLANVTGSGKTFTMFGDDTAGDDIYSSGRVPPSAGLIPRVVHELFAHIKRNRKTCTAVVSFMQIYNEQIYDLLRDPRRGSSLTIKEDRFLQRCPMQYFLLLQRFHLQL